MDFVSIFLLLLYLSETFYNTTCNNNIKFSLNNFKYLHLQDCTRKASSIVNDQSMCNTDEVTVLCMLFISQSPGLLQWHLSCNFNIYLFILFNVSVCLYITIEYFNLFMIKTRDLLFETFPDHSLHYLHPTWTLHIQQGTHNHSCVYLFTYL